MYQVKVYFQTNATHYFPARDKRNAREIAARVSREGAWIINTNGTEEFYPVGQVYKVKILPPDYIEPEET